MPLCWLSQSHARCPAAFLFVFSLRLSLFLPAFLSLSVSSSSLHLPHQPPSTLSSPPPPPPPPGPLVAVRSLLSTSLPPCLDWFRFIRYTPACFQEPSILLDRLICCVVITALFQCRSAVFDDLQATRAFHCFQEAAPVWRSPAHLKLLTWFQRAAIRLWPQFRFLRLDLPPFPNHSIRPTVRFLLKTGAAPECHPRCRILRLSSRPKIQMTPVPKARPPTCIPKRRPLCRYFLSIRAQDTNPNHLPALLQVGEVDTVADTASSLEVIT